MASSKDKGPKAAQQTRGPVGHWADLHQPPSFEEAIAGLKAAYDGLTGGDKIRAAYGAEVAILFGTAQIPHDEHPLMTADRSADPDHARQVLEGVLAQHDGTRAAAVIPWGTIVATLLPLIIKWLSGQS